MIKQSRAIVGIVLAVSLGVLLLTLSLLMDAPRTSIAAPLLQWSEQEDNDDFDQADGWGSVPMPGYVNGYINGTGADADTIDYYLVDTQSGRQYQVSLTVLDNPDHANLQLRLYDSSRNLIGSSPSSPSYTSMSWTSYQAAHYIRVEAFVITPSVTIEYRLDLDELSVSPTPSHTPVPSSTPTPTSTPIAMEDNYEQNDDFTQAYTLPVGTIVTLSDLDGLATFFPANDDDWFSFYVKDSFWYEVTTMNLNQCDTYLEIRDRNNNIVEHDDDSGGGYASLASWEAQYDGYYYIRAINMVNTNGSYDMSVEEIDEPPTPTPGPSPTPGEGADPQADECEFNFDFGSSCTIPANSPLNLNFVPPYGGVDNDFFRIWVKPGLIFECYTENLSPGVDPNMIVFTGPSWDQAIGGNDDLEPGDYNCGFTYYATYQGWFYLLVGTGDRTPSDVYDSDYTLTCEMRAPGVPNTPTPVPTNTPGPTSTPGGTTPTPSATPSPTPTEPGGALVVRPISTPTPPPPPEDPTLRFVPVELLIYYDGNNDQSPGAGEGIPGILAMAYDTATGGQIAEGYTDELGHLQFTAAAQGAVRLSIPYLGVSRLVGSEGDSIYVRIGPLHLP